MPELHYFFILLFGNFKTNLYIQNMSYQLIILEEQKLALIYLQTKLVKFTIDHPVYNIHNIYLGKIDTILPSLDAAFIFLHPKEKNGFIRLENLKTFKKEKTQDLKIRPQEELLVQINKEPSGIKGPSVTSEVHIPGKYLKLYPLVNEISLNKKLHPERDIDYLRAMGTILTPKNLGMNINGEILHKNTYFLLKESHILKHKWKQILKNSKTNIAPSLVSRKKNFILQVLEDLYQKNIKYIGIDSYEGALKLKHILGKLQKSKTELIIESYNNSSLLVNKYSLDIIISKALEPKVKLTNGGYIVIEKTEALTAIDVNSGSFINLSNSRETSFWINYCAVPEIIQQIKLRNIGGIIVIDFIDSNNQEDQMTILTYLNKLIKEDYIMSNLIQVSELGLVEITRSRQSQNIYDAFSRKCENCDGLGYKFKHKEIQTYKQNEICTEFSNIFSKTLLTITKIR